MGRHSMFSGRLGLQNCSQLYQRLLLGQMTLVPRASLGTGLITAALHTSTAASKPHPKAIRLVSSMSG